MSSQKNDKNVLFITSTLSQNTITNSAIVTYNYTVNPSSSNVLSDYRNTNLVSINVVQVGLDITKYVNKAVTNVGDNLDYKIVLKNSGNVPINNVVVIDTIPVEGVFVNNSITIDSTIQPSVNLSPPLGLSIGNINASEIKTITYRVMVNTIPTTNNISNFAYVGYSYILDPSIGNVVASKVSNVVNTSIQEAKIICNKYVDKTNGAVGDELTYTIRLSNVGNASANLVVFTDTIAPEMSFIVDSIKINNTIKAGETIVPPNGFLLGSINAGITNTIVFKTKVNSIPSSGIIDNGGILNYKYTADLIQVNNISKIIATNIVSTNISTASLSSTKIVNKSGVYIGDVIVYTIVIKNNGNISANNIQMIETIPNGITFISNTLTINGMIQSGVKPNEVGGVTISNNLTSNSTSTITFNVRVDTIPSSNPIISTTYFSYNYTIPTSIPDVRSKGIITNSVNTRVNSIDIKAIKSVDKGGAFVGDTLNYVIRIVNGGNTDISNIIFIDTIPSGTSFINDSLKIDNILKIGESLNSSGYRINILPAGRTTTIEFSLSIDTIPTPNPIKNSSYSTFQYTLDPSVPNGVSLGVTSNIVSTTVVNTNINITKISDVQGASIGDYINYTININNYSNIPISSINVKDTIPSGTIFVTDSVKVNEVTRIGENPSFINGININTIPAGSSSSITFKVMVNTMPKGAIIENNAIVTYKYIVDNSNPVASTKGIITNKVFTNIAEAIVSVNKYVDKRGATYGEKLTYTIEVKNQGNISINNVTVIDTVPKDLIFVDGSVKINGNVRGQDIPSNGIFIPSIDKTSTLTITFEAVISVLATSTIISNSAIINYYYTVDANNPDSKSNTLITNSTITKLGKAEIITTEYVNKDIAIVGDTLIYTIVVKNVGNIKIDSIIFSSTIVSESSFLDNSIEVNGLRRSGAPYDSNIGLLDVGNIFTINFKTVVNTVPSNNEIINSGVILYKYILDPSMPNILIGSSNTNIVKTKILQTLLSATKISSKTGLSKGDTLTYTINIRNVGTTNLQNVVVVDTLPFGTSFVPYSIYLNGVNDTSIDRFPIYGVNVGNINIGANITLAFDIKLDTVPTNNKISNAAYVGCKYVIDPTLARYLVGGVSTNTINVSCGEGILNTEMIVDKDVAGVNENVIYTVILRNIGSIPLNNLLLINTIPNYTSFVLNSVSINGIIQGNVSPSPPNGITISNIDVGKTTTIDFKVLTQTIPIGEFIYNSSTITFRYTVDPNNLNSGIGKVNTNFVSTKVVADLVATAIYVNKEEAFVGDNLNYFIRVENKGNLIVNNVKVTTTIPQGTSLIDGSINVNGITQSYSSWQNYGGINLGNISPGQTVTASYLVKVNTMTQENPINSRGNIYYEYTINLKSGIFKRNIATNIVSTKINIIQFSIAKKVNKVEALVGQELTYTIMLSNNGNVQENNIVLIDTIPNELGFVNSSVVVNSITIPGASPMNIGGIQLGSLLPGKSTTVNFRTVILGVPSTGKIENSATAIYRYYTNSLSQNEYFGGANSNFVTTQIREAKINLKKSVDKEVAKIGDKLVYSIILDNRGNTDVNNITLIDTIPNEVNFIGNSLYINGISKGSITVEPPNGVLINELKSNQSTEVKFSVLVNTIPTIGKIDNKAWVRFSYSDINNPLGFSSGDGISDKVETIINQPNIVVVKYVDKKFAKLKDILTYTVVLKNIGNISANDVIFKNTKFVGVNFIEGSVYLNGINRLYESVEETKGINLGSIKASNLITLTYKAIIQENLSLTIVESGGNISYKYILDQKSNTMISSGISANNVSTLIRWANIENIIKSTDKTTVGISDVITYTVSMKNTGNATANNVVFTDTIPERISIVENSFKVDNILMSGVTPSLSGINIGSIAPGKITTISFKVKVDTLPRENPIKNSATIKYNYNIDPSIPNFEECSGNSNIVNTKVNYARISSIDRGFIKYVDKNSTDLNDTITYTIILKNTGNIEANKVIFKDSIPIGTILIKDSVKVNNRTLVSSNPELGILLGSISPDEERTIEFKVKGDNKKVISPIENIARIEYSYIASENTINYKVESALSNKVSTTIGFISISKEDGSISMGVDKSVIKLGEYVTYTFLVENKGNVTANNVVVFTDLSSNINILEGSITINGISKPRASFNMGIKLGKISGGQTVTIAYKARPNSYSIQNNIVLNTAKISYDYS